MKQTCLKKTILFFVVYLIIIVFPRELYSQQLEWESIFDTGQDDISKNIDVDSIGNVFVAGQSDYINGYGIVIKFNASGDTLWTRRNDIIINGLACDSNGDVLVGGVMFINDSNRVCLIKYNSNGETIWSYESKGLDIYSSAAVSGCLATDLGNNIVYIAKGVSRLNDWYDFITIKFDPQGNMLWNQFYDGEYNWRDSPQSVTIDKQDNIIITGSSENDQDWDWLTLKYSNNGDFLWGNRMDNYYEDRAKGVITDNNGSVIVVGNTDSTGYSERKNWARVIKYSSEGDSLWSLKLVGDLDSDVIRLNAVDVDSLGNIFTCGVLKHYQMEIGKVWEEFYLAKINTTGQIIWTYKDSIDNNLINHIQDLKVLNDKIFLSGHTNLSNVVGRDDIYIAKLIDIKSGVSRLENMVINPKIKNFPNPFNNITTISYELYKESRVDIDIYDLRGKRLEVLASEFQVAGIHNIIWEASNLPSGVYILRIQAGQMKYNRKILMLK